MTLQHPSRKFRHPFSSVKATYSTDNVDLTHSQRTSPAASKVNAQSNTCDYFGKSFHSSRNLPAHRTLCEKEITMKIAVPPSFTNRMNKRIQMPRGLGPSAFSMSYQPRVTSFSASSILLPPHTVSLFTMDRRNCDNLRFLQRLSEALKFCSPRARAVSDLFPELIECSPCFPTKARPAMWYLLFCFPSFHL